MPEPRVANLLRHIVHWDTNHGPAINVMHCENSGGASTLPAANTAIIESLHDLFMTVVSPATVTVGSRLSSGAAITHVETLDFSVIDGPAVEGTPSPGIFGSAVGSLPGQIACVQSWRTGLAGRSKRGRTYIPALGVNSIDGVGHWHSTFRTAVESASAAFITALATTYNTPLVVYSRKGLGSFTEVTGVIVDERADVQRSRGQ